MFGGIEIGLRCHVKILFVVSINLIGSIRFSESSLEVELMPGIVSPTKKPINGLETYPDENGVSKDDAFLKLLDEGFTVYEKLKIPGLAEADDLLYDYSEREKGSRVFFPDFPDIPEIPALSKNETGEGKDNGREKEDDKDDDEDDEDDVEDEEKKVSNQETGDEDNEEEGDGVKENNKERSTITEDDDNQRKNVKTLNQVIPVDPDAIKMLDKGEPFISQRINVSAEKVPKIMNVETVNSRPHYNYNSNVSTKKSNSNNGNMEKDNKLVLLSYGGRYGGKPKALRPLNPEELKQAIYHHQQQQQPMQRNSQQQLNHNSERRKQDQISAWKPPSYPPPWTVTNHKNNRKNDFNNENRSPNEAKSDKKSRGSVIDKSKMYESLNGNDDDYHRIAVPTTPDEGDEQASPSPINPQSNSIGTDFFEEHLLALRSRRHRGKRQILETSDHSDIQVTPSPLGLAGLYEGPMVIPLNPSFAHFDELYRRLLLQQLSLEGDQSLPYIEENSYFIPEGIRSLRPPSSSTSSPSPSSSLRNHLLSTPYHSQSSSVRTPKASGYCIHGYPGQPYSCKNSFKHNTPIVHKPGVDEPHRLRNIYMNYLENSFVNQQPIHHAHHPFHFDSFTNPSSFHTHSKVHNHHSSDFEQAMRLIPDEPVTYLQPYGSFTIQPSPKAYDTLDPISLSQYHELVNTLHNQIGLGNPSIMSTDVDVTPTMHPKLVSTLTKLAANVANSGPRPVSLSDSHHSIFPSNFESYHNTGKSRKLGLFGKNRIFGSKTDSKIVQFMNKLSEERDKSRKNRDSEYFKGKIKRSSDPDLHDNLNDKSNKISTLTSPSSLPSLSTPGTHQIMANGRPKTDLSQVNLTNVNGTSKFQ